MRITPILVIGGNEARPLYLQYAICDASWSTGACILSSVVRAPQQKRQHQQHILESRLTCFLSLSYLGRTRNFSEGSVQQHPSPCSFRKRVGRKREKHRARPTSSTFHFSFSCGMAYSRGNRAPESEIRQTSVYLIKRKMEKKFCIRTRYVYISFCGSTRSRCELEPSSRENSS